MAGVADGIWASAAGLRAAAWEVDVLAQDVANVDTPGFRALLPETEDAAPLPVYPAGLAVGPAAPPDVLAGGGSGPGTAVLDTAEGPLQQTGRALDAAIVGPGLFALRDAVGATVYARAGRFFVDAQGQLVDAAGRLLLDAGGQPLRLPAGVSDVRLEADGSVTVAGQAGPVAVGRIGVAVLTDAQGLQGDGLGVWVATPAAGTVRLGPPDGTTVRLQAGVLEGSNVDLSEALPRLLAARRAYQASLQALQVGLRLWDRSNQLHA